MTGSTIGHYEVGEKLGAGGMGEVYRARDVKLRRDVALKFLPADLSRDPLARARFLREAQAASALEHPNIATIYEIAEHDERLYIAMALYEGDTLLERMRRAPLSIEECEQVIRQLLDAVCAAHAAGVIHRDLKPANVILTRGGSSPGGRPPRLQVKVVDFGLAKRGEGGQETQTHLTAAGALMGTVAYMSPEQARGGEIDGRSDLWSIGVIAYEMLAGRHPFEAPSSVGTLTRIATEEPDSLDLLRAEAPERLRRLVDALLRKDREQRPASADRALLLLDRPAPVASGSAGVLPAAAVSIPAGSPAAAPPRGRLRPWHWAIGVAALLAGVLAVVLPRWLPRAAPSGAPAASFVVLPCQVFGADDFSYLTDAVPATLSTLLAQVPGLDTRRPPTSFEVDPARVDLARLARAFRVRNCVTCSVMAEDGNLLLSLQLVDPRTLTPLWSASFEGTTGGKVELIKESAVGIRNALLPGAAEGIAEATSGGSTADLAFQRGRYHAERYNDKRDPKDLALAMDALQEALRLDPQLADAAAQIAILKLWSLTSSERIETEVDDWARRALDIDETCSRAWTALAFIEWARRDVDQGLDYALEAFRHAGDDGLAHWPMYSFLKLFANGPALRVVERSTEANPLYAWGYIGQASALFQQGEINEAVVRLDRALEIEEDSYAANAYKSIFLATAGRLDEARGAFGRVADLEEPTPPYLRQYARFALDLAASRPAARRAALDAFAAGRCRTFECLDEAYRYLTPLLIRHGAVELAVEMLEEYSTSGIEPAYDWLVLSPDLGPLRVHPSYETIRARAADQYARFRERLEASQRHGDLPPMLQEPLADLESRIDVR